MMNNDILNKVQKQASELLETIQAAEKEAVRHVETLPEGKQKEMLKLALKKAKKGELNTKDFLKQFQKHA
jgi:vacuolar-type H+-ATPase subunit H